MIAGCTQDLLESGPRRPLLTAEEERDLARRRDAGDHSARQELIDRNLRLVVKLAGRFASRSLSLPLDDLVGYGMIGLCRGADLFDPAKGIRFSTFASGWIKQSMARSIADYATLVRVPAYLHDAEPFKKRAGGGSSPEHRQILEAAKRAFRTSSARGRSGEESIGDPTDVLPYPGGQDAVDDRDAGEWLRLAVDRLPAESRQAIRMYYGLDGPPMKMDAIAPHAGVCREVVRQRINLGLDILRMSHGEDLP